VPQRGSTLTDLLLFFQTLKALEEEGEVVILVFDRHRGSTIAGAGVIEPHHEILLVEGNYLLLKQEP
jgi:pantothenate kinase